MKNNTNNIFEWVLTAFQGVLTALQTDEILRYVQLVLAVVSAVLTLAFTIFKWYKTAKKDGKITKEEVEELITDSKGDFDTLKTSLDNITSKEEKDDATENK